jgi:hypothetical protein
MIVVRPDIVLDAVYLHFVLLRYSTHDDSLRHSFAGLPFIYEKNFACQSRNIRAQLGTREMNWSISVTALAFPA